MKTNTLLLIGAIALVLQNATAQPYTLYYNDFSGQNLGDTPRNPDGTPLLSWTGNASATTWDVEDHNVFSGIVGPAAYLTWTITDTTSWGTGFSIGDMDSIPGGELNALSDLTFSMILGVTGAPSTQPVTIWFDQFRNGVRNFDASYTPTLIWINNGRGSDVTFTLDQLTVNQGAYDPEIPFLIDVDSGPAGMQYVIGADQVIITDVLLMANYEPVPEPGTIALLTLGGSGALVAIRRRRA